MKTKNLLMILAGSAMTLLATPAFSAAAEMPAREVRLSTIKLDQPEGYGVEVTGGRIGKRRQVLAVSVGNGPLSTSYSVKTPVGPRLRGSFGSMGRIDVRFERRKKQVERPERGCRWIIEKGIFRGSFNFVGEQGYFSSQAVDPEGEVFRLPDGFCGLGDFRVAGVALPGLRETVLEASASGESEDISFRASQMEAFRRPDPRISFDASLRERVGKMRIERQASANAKAATFSHAGAAHATVAPPAPFAGSGEYTRSATGPLWTGNLSVSFLGAPERALTGEPFAARLCPHIVFLSHCLKKPLGPAGWMSSRYGSGSHSQPLALARLSSLR
jgi:hypothetical protein